MLRGRYVGGKCGQRNGLKIQVAGCGRGRESTPILPARFRWDEDNEPHSRPPRFPSERRGLYLQREGRHVRQSDSPNRRFCLSGCRAYGLIRAMNKKEAAEYLNVSTRAIERYTAQGKLTPTYEKGRTGLAPVYDQEQLDQVKKQMDEAGNAIHAPIQTDKPDKKDKTDKPDKDGALVLRSGNRADLAAFIAAIDKARGQSVADLAAKPLLTRDEAQRLTGLSRGFLKEAVASGQLKERLLGRAYRIKRTELEAYIETL